MREVDVKKGDLVVANEGAISGYVQEIYAIDSDVHLEIVLEDGEEIHIPYDMIDSIVHDDEPQESKMSVVIPVVGGTGTEEL